MRAFAHLFTELDQTTRTSEKVAALQSYFSSAPPADAAWALWFLSGQRLKRAVTTTQLRLWAADASHLPLWLVEECFEHVGDLGEALALLLPPNPDPRPLPLARLVEERLLPLPTAPEAVQRDLLRTTWAELDTTQRFLWNKLITGNFRVGVSRALLIRALALQAGVAPAIMAHRLAGAWRPTADDFGRLMSGETDGDDPARPYPFFLASPLEEDLESLGEAQEWQVEWKWDGVRAQLLRRGQEAILWSRGEEMITKSFPEISEAALALPEGTVLDGELLAWQDDRPLPFAQLQRRLNRREPGPALQAKIPVAFMTYDLLEWGGQDWRSRPLAERRRELERLIVHARENPTTRARAGLVQGELFDITPGQKIVWPLRVSTLLPANSWQEVAAFQEKARATGAEGLMLKRRTSTYGVGRQRGPWWKWKVQPFTCDAVLVAAQPGHGRRATLFTDYTFAVWQNDELVPVAKAYSGLTDDEIDAVDAFVRTHTTGRYGPVRLVTPELVFELAFEGIAVSSRHKAGLALRFPRINRWRHDKKAVDADHLQVLERLANRSVN